MKTILYISIIILIFGCSGFSKRIEITSEYVINQNWNRKGGETWGNTIEIKRMRLKKDSTLNPYSDLDRADLLNKLEVDSTFIYTANIGQKYKEKKIFFDKDNGFVWWTDKGEKKMKAIGKLQKNTWYEISRLTYYYHIVYVDSIDKVHLFIINPSNW